MQAEPQDTSSTRIPSAGIWPFLVLLGLIALCCGVELVLIAADYGFIGTPRWRGLAYQNGAFWAGLLYDWRPNYTGQPGLMFFTYAFLHSGLGHLIGNMLTLFFLGGIVLDRVGVGGLLVIYAISAIGGAVAFALLNSSPQPMVGASGALFGLAAAWQYWGWIDRRRMGRPVWAVVWTVLGLVALNVALWFWLGGGLAWETHLGGFIAGWLCTMVLRSIGKG